MNKIVLLLLLIVLSSCTNTKRIISVNHADLPTPIGPYSHSISYGDLIFVSGQIGIDPKSNTLKQGIQEQTIQIFENLKAILKSNDSDLNHITKTTIFITDLKNFEVVNKIYGSYFQNQFPARSTIEIAALPKNAAIEIECIAVKIPN
jgi:2-iminobutanoate/2-iminopropanoate deaminase